MCTLTNRWLPYRCLLLTLGLFSNTLRERSVAAPSTITPEPTPVIRRPIAVATTWAGFGVSQRKWIECEKFSLSQRKLLIND